MALVTTPVSSLAIMAIDPGGTTGVAACQLEVYPTVKETLLEGIRKAKAVEVRGNWLDQARELSAMADRFRFNATVDSGIAVEDVHVVMENYIPDPHRIGRGATNLDPVWVGAAFCGLQGQEPVWQTPAEAKGYAKDERLRLWGLWEVGSAHKRDAWRHVASRLNRLLV